MDILANSQSVADREDQGTTIHLRDAAGEKQYQDEAKTKPVTVTVVGTYSKRYRRASEASNDKMLKQRRKSLEAEQLDELNRELTASCILGWDGLMAGDQPFDYSKKNAMLLLEAAPWVREQVEAAMNDHASFLQRSN